MPDGEQITPKNNFFLLGQEEAEKALLGAYNSNKLHNSWLISGVKGIGKATLAYRFARFLLDERRRSFSPGVFAGDGSGQSRKPLGFFRFSSRFQSH